MKTHLRLLGWFYIVTCGPALALGLAICVALGLDTSVQSRTTLQFVGPPFLIVACFGLVADFDDADAARWADRLPIPPQYVLETSSGRFQAFYFFTKPVPPEAAKPVAERLKAYAGCDYGTADISHVWRVAGTLNWPNAKKVNEGRSAEPQLVKVV